MNFTCPLCGYENEWENDGGKKACGRCETSFRTRVKDRSVSEVETPPERDPASEPKKRGMRGYLLAIILVLKIAAIIALVDRPRGGPPIQPQQLPPAHSQPYFLSRFQELDNHGRKLTRLFEVRIQRDQRLPIDKPVLWMKAGEQLQHRPLNAAGVLPGDFTFTFEALVRMIPDNAQEMEIWIEDQEDRREPKVAISNFLKIRLRK